MSIRLPTISPQLCRAAAAPPTGAGWVHEIKHDGHRIIAAIEHGQVRLLSRPGNDATRRFAPVAAWLSKLRVKRRSSTARSRCPTTGASPTSTS